MKALLTIVLTVASANAWAQHVEVMPLVGYTTEAPIDHDPAEVEDLSMSRGVTWGAQGTYFISDHIGVEGLWSYQSTNVFMTANGGNGELFEMTMNQVHGNLVYQFRGAAASLTPFVFGGLGATFMDATDMTGATKLTWTIGGGIKWFPLRHLGVRGHARFKPTQLNDGSGDFCNPFGFCQTLLTHFELAAGAVFRF